MNGFVNNRRLFSYSLRALLVLTTVIVLACGLLGFKLRQSEQQALAIERIRELGGQPLLTTSDGRHINESNTMKSSFLRKILGDDFFVCVPLIELTDSSLSAGAIRSMIPHIRKIIPVEGMNEADKSYVALHVAGNPNIDEELLTQMRERLPNCEFVRYTPVPDKITSVVRLGMQQQEVINVVGSMMYDQRIGWVGEKQPIVDMLGSLHQQYIDAEFLTSWTYYTDDVGIGVFGIDFDADGRVSRTWAGRGSPPQGKNITRVGPPEPYSGN